MQNNEQNNKLNGGLKPTLRTLLSFNIIIALLALPHIFLHYYQYTAKSCIIKNQYTCAEKALNKQLIIKKWSFGNNDKDIAIILNHLGDVYAQQGKYKEAFKTIELAFIYEKTIAQLQNIKSLKKDMDFEKKLNISYLSKINSANAKNSIMSNTCVISNLSIMCCPEIIILPDLYLSQGKYDDAEKFYNRAINDLKKLKLEYISTQVKLLSSYIDQNNYKKAEVLLNSITKDKNYNDKNIDPETRAFILYNKSKIFSHRKNYDNAAKYLKQSLSIAEKVYDDRFSQEEKQADNYNHYLIDWEFDLADIYIFDKKYVEAEKFLKKLESKIEKGEFRSRYIAAVYYGLALISEDIKKYNNAESFYKKGISLEQTRGYSKDIPAVKSKIQLSKLYLIQKKLDKALAILKEVKEVIEDRKYDSIYFPDRKREYQYFSRANQVYKSLMEIYKLSGKKDLAGYYKTKFDNSQEIYSRYYK
ncbi:MAG: hypothetical protein PHC34_12070 [Candidatus Gastranaerophilales bacterium]|nr:hypothetical protein [Candidatus Gastranaerophilales bacterium]